MVAYAEASEFVLPTRAGLAVTVFDRVDPNPRVASVRAGADVARAAGCDVLVAVGGGSVIDTVNAVGLVPANGGDVVEYDFTLDEPRPIERPITPLVAVPATAGTGSEVTFWAVVTDHERIAARCAETIGEYAVPRPLAAADFLAVLRAADGR